MGNMLNISNWLLIFAGPMFLIFSSTEAGKKGVLQQLSAIVVIAFGFLSCFSPHYDGIALFPMFFGVMWLFACCDIFNKDGRPANSNRRNSVGGTLRLLTFISIILFIGSFFHEYIENIRWLIIKG